VEANGMGVVIALCFALRAVISPIPRSWFANKVVIGRTVAVTNSQPSPERVATAQGR